MVQIVLNKKKEERKQMKTYKIKTETNGEKVKYYLRADSKYDAYRKAYEKEL